MITVVAVQQRRPAGGENSAGRYGGRIYLREHQITPAVNRTYGLGSIVITDSVNPIQLTRDAYHDIARSVGVPCLDVEVVCSNPKLHRERVENRTVDIEGLALPDWQAVIYRDYQPWNRERLILDSATLSVEQSVERIIAALAQES